MDLNSYPSSLLLLSGIWRHLSTRRRAQFVGLFLVMIISSFSEVLSLGAILPFLALLSDINMLWNYSYVKDISQYLGFTSPQQLMLPVTLLFAVASSLSTSLRLLNVWLTGQFAARVGSDLSREVYSRTLNQPYDVHIQRNSSDLIHTLTTQLTRSVAAISSFLQLSTALIISVSLVIGLLAINFQVALCSIILFGTIYAILAFFSKNELTRNSNLISAATAAQIKILQEGLGAIRDVLLDSNQSAYTDIYVKKDRLQRRLQAKNMFITIFPRFVIEGVGLVSLAFLGLFLVSVFGSGGNIIPVLGAMALGAQRLLPTLQQVYGSWAKLRGLNADLFGVLQLLRQPVMGTPTHISPLDFRDQIEFRDVYFSYNCSQPDVICGLNLKIKSGDRIGLIGTTGSGKSTTIDLLMGLLVPTKGNIYIDGVDLHDEDYSDRIFSWRSLISHVPQNIFLADSSIAENIAFGVPIDQIDLQLVKYAADMAHISGFIDDLPNGYSTIVGEWGVRLSGGQKQRIGIARALYKKSRILILDEGTSALDNDTEASIINSINSLSKDITIIMIAHRLSTIQGCSQIIELDNGISKRMN